MHPKTTKNTKFENGAIVPGVLSIYVEKPVILFRQMEQYVWKKQLFRCGIQMERFFPPVILGN